VDRLETVNYPESSWLNSEPTFRRELDFDKLTNESRHEGEMSKLGRLVHLAPPVVTFISSSSVAQRARELRRGFDFRSALRCLEFLGSFPTISNPDALQPSETRRDIWQVWIQPNGQPPRLVRNILRANSENVNGHRLLTSEREIADLVDIPGAIWDLYRSGSLRAANFVDIVRSKLLGEHGGFWLDATVLVSKPDILNAEFFLMQTGHENKPNSLLANYEYSSWALAARQGDPFHLTVSEAMVSLLIDSSYRSYFLHGLVMSAVMRKSPEICQLYAPHIRSAEFIESSGVLRSTRVEEGMQSPIKIFGGHPLHKLTWKIRERDLRSLAIAPLYGDFSEFVDFLRDLEEGEVHG